MGLASANTLPISGECLRKIEPERRIVGRIMGILTEFGVFTSVKFRFQTEGQHPGELYGQFRKPLGARGGGRREKVLHGFQDNVSDEKSLAANEIEYWIRCRRCPISKESSWGAPKKIFITNNIAA